VIHRYLQFTNRIIPTSVFKGSVPRKNSSYESGEHPDFNLYKSKKKTKLRGLSLLANYTDRATAACRRSYADRWCHVVSMTDPYGSILGFLEQSLFHIIPLNWGQEVSSKFWYVPNNTVSHPRQQLPRRNSSLLYPSTECVNTCSLFPFLSVRDWENPRKI
jgi:hypothetical protein